MGPCNVNFYVNTEEESLNGCVSLKNTNDNTNGELLFHYLSYRTFRHINNFQKINRQNKQFEDFFCYFLLDKTDLCCDLLKRD